MARQTRRRRDSKSKSRYRPRFPSSATRDSSVETDGRTSSLLTKKEKFHLPTVLILLAIFLFSLYIRTAWTIEPATEDGFQLTGGSDPYYHKRVVDYVAENGEHLQNDPMLNYPYGANNARPPLFDWSIAIIGLALSPFFSSSEESVWWAMEVLPAIYGALIIFPVYAIGKAQFGREAGLIGAFFIGVNSGHVSHSSLALADHDSYIILFATTSYFFFMRALTVSGDRKWVSDWTKTDEIRKGFVDFFKNERLALGYAGLAGITIAMISMSWKGFPYIMAIIVVYLGFQMMINAFRRIDSMTTAMIGLVTLSMPVILSYPYYSTMGFIATWWEAPAYILLGYIIYSILMVTTRDLPWLLVIGSAALIASTTYLLLTYVFEELGFLLLGGQGYFVRTKLFDTIAEAQPPEFADFVFAFGPVSIWLGIFGIIWMAYQLYNQSIWKKDYLFVMIWALVSIFMAQSAVRFIFNATPVVSLVSGWITWLIIKWADFPAVATTWKSVWGKRGELFLWLTIAAIFAGIWFFFTVSILIGILSTLILISLIMIVGHMDAQGDDQYRFRDRLSGLRKGYELKRTLVVIFVGLFVFLPNTFYGYDAGIPYQDKKDHDAAIYDFLSYDFLRPDEYQNDQRYNETLYPGGVSGMYNTTNNQLWYMGNTGPSFPSDYWIDGLEWLAEQDTNEKPEDRPGFIAWWDYGFWAIDIGEHPTVADNFQFGYQIAGNFITSQSEHEAMALLLYRLIETEVNRDTGKFNDEVRIVLLNYLSEEKVSEFEHIVDNPDDYIPKNPDGSEQEVHKKNAAIRAGKPILMELDKSTIADLIWEIEQTTGNSIRYFGADTRMMPYSADNTGILYAPVTLADYDIDDFVEIQAVLSDGQTVPFDEAIDLLENNPDLQVSSQSLVYKENFLNSMFFRAFIGWSAPDIGREITDGIPGISGSIAQDNSLPPLPGWNLTHFKLVQFNSGLRMLKYYDGATISGTVSTPDGMAVANANVTVLDEYRTPHATVTTDKYGKYSILVPAGNLTLAVSMGTPEEDIEKVFKTSNNLLMREENIIITEEQAMRQTTSEINIDLEVEPSSISGRLYWDMDKDGEFGGDDESIPLVDVLAHNKRSEDTVTVKTNSNGKYDFEGLAPGEYTLTTNIEGHEVELASYLGTAAIRANQDLDIKQGLKPGAVWGKFEVSDDLPYSTVTVSLYDHTNDSKTESTLPNNYYFDKDCGGNVIDYSISFCFDHLLPGNYTLRVEDSGILSDNTAEWSNNTVEIVMAKGGSKSLNSTLRPGFRLEGKLSTPNGDSIPDKQIVVRNIDGSYMENIFSTETGYFVTVLPGGTYDIYSIHQTEQTSFAYLNRVDSNNLDFVDAKMKPGHTISGILFDDRDNDGCMNCRAIEQSDEKGIGDMTITFDTGNGATSAFTDVDGSYTILLPEGSYSAYSEIPMDENSIEVSLKSVELIGDMEENIPSKAGQDAMLILYEMHMGNDIPLSGIVRFDQIGTNNYVNLFAADPGTFITLPVGEDYDLSIEKYGYSLENLYLSPKDPNDPRTPIEKFELKTFEELLVEVKRNPSEVTGRVVHNSIPIENTKLSFSPVDNISYSLDFENATDESGNFQVMLPPEEYIYTFTYEQEGVRYFTAGQMSIPIGTEVHDMGVVETELTYLLSGSATLNDILTRGQIILTNTSDFDDITIIETTNFEEYSQYVFPGEYYVTFDDRATETDLTFGGIVNMDGAKTFNLDLKAGGSTSGDVASQADENRLVEEGIKVEFWSLDDDISIPYIARTDEDGQFGASVETGRFDLPAGNYTIRINKEGYEEYNKNVTVEEAGAEGNFLNLYAVDTETGIFLTPKLVNATFEIKYNNATGSNVPLEGVTVYFVDKQNSDNNFNRTTDSEGEVNIIGMVPKRYEMYIDQTMNDDRDLFTLDTQEINIRAGDEEQTFKRTVEWKVKVEGTVFYDRNYDGVPDEDEILPNSNIEIWSIDGNEMRDSTTANEEGDYSIYMKTGAYNTWFYTTADTTYVDLTTLELENATELTPTMSRGVNYKTNYQSSVTSENIDFGEIDITGENFSYNIVADEGFIDLVVPSGTYIFDAEYRDNSGDDDYIYILEDSIEVNDSLDQVLQNQIVDRKLMRGIEIEVDTLEDDIPIGQTAIITFNVTSTGHLDTIYETNIENIPANWNASFEPNKLSLATNGSNMKTELRITPDNNVVAGVWETFTVKFTWSDGSSNDVDDITKSFDVKITPIEAPEPDYIVSEILWNPQSPVVGDEVTLTATIKNMVNNSGPQQLPILFSDGTNTINITTAIFNGTDQEEVTVTGVWTATEGAHSLKVIIDSENMVDESNEDNNEKSISISVSSADDDDDNSSMLRMAALVVVGLVAGLAYVSYRSRR